MRNLCKIAAILIVLTLQAQARPGWATNLEEACKQAEKENKAVLVLFTGPDWCRPCQMVEQTIFSKKEFVDLLSAEVVLVEWVVPHPRTKPEESNKASTEAFNQFGIRSYPSVILLKPDKTRIATLKPTQGIPTPEAFAATVQVELAHKPK